MTTTLRFKGVKGETPWKPIVNWATNTDYLVGPPASVVSYDGSSYVCSVSHRSTSIFDSSKWTALAIRSDVLASSCDGSWNATLNEPPITSGVGQKGHYRIVKTSGNTLVDGEDQWNSGDWIFFNGSTYERIVNPIGGIIDYDPTNRDLGGGYVWYLVDQNDNVIFGVDSSLRLNTHGVTVPVDIDRDRISPSIDLVKTNDGQLVGINRLTGNIMVPGIELEDNVTRDNIRPVIPIITTNDSIPVSIDRSGGLIFNVRPDGNRGIVATSQDADGYTCDIYQQSTFKTDTAVAINSRGIRGVIVIGQSHTSAASGPIGTVTSYNNKAPHHILMTSTALERWGDTNWSSIETPPDDFVPLIPRLNYGHCIVTCSAEALIAYERKEGARSPPRVYGISTRGGIAFEQFLPNTSGRYSYENALLDVSRMASCAKNYPMPFLLEFILIIHGENANESSESWASVATTLLDSAVSDYKEITGQEQDPHVIIVQTNTGTDATVANGNELSQIELARTRPDTYLAGPMYQYPFHNYEGGPGIYSKIHIDNIGRLMLAEVIAIAQDCVGRRNISWNPLWPVLNGASRVGNVITIPMVLPPDCTTLFFDNDWVQNVTNKGFTFSQTGGNNPTIQSVEIDGTNIVITLDVAPTGTNKTISYAIQNDSYTDGWATGRGQLYTNDIRKSIYHDLGYNTFEYVRHYSVRFKETVS
jgi:hypothetical protein